jgi:hypothetical protein
VSVIQFGCPFCGAVAEVDADRAGEETVCPACECLLVIPVPESPAPDAAAAEPLAEPPATKQTSPKPSAQRSKPKLWQTSSRPEATGAAASSSPELPQPFAPQSSKRDAELLPASAPLVDPLSDFPGASPLDLDEPAAGKPYGRRATAIAREELQRRRFWSNVIMLVGSIIILFGVLAGLMYFGG